MKLPILTLCLAFLASPTFAAPPEYGMATLNLALAHKMIALNSPRAQLLDPDNAMMKDPTMRKVIQNLDFDTIERDAAGLMATRFTRQELTTLITFYTSDIGMSIESKMGPYQKLLGGLIEEAMQKKFKEMLAAGEISAVPNNGPQTPNLQNLR